MTSRAPVDVLASRVEGVRQRITLACERAGRAPGEVTLVAVSKTWSADDVASAWHAGLRDFGENRVQEALPKIEDLAARGLNPTWHLVGHLQTNKVKAAVNTFAILHSVDSERLVEAIAATGQPTRIMIEVNVSGEPTKFGLAPEALPALVGVARSYQHLRVEGLMTVAPLTVDPQEARPVFRRLRELAREHGLASLSMGMTDDFEVAIEEGATHVRVGRAIFGERRA